MKDHVHVHVTRFLISHWKYKAKKQRSRWHHISNSIINHNKIFSYFLKHSLYKPYLKQKQDLHQCQLPIWQSNANKSKEKKRWKFIGYKIFICLIKCHELDNKTSTTTAFFFFLIL